MRRAAFEELVREAIATIPDDFLNIMTNVDFHVRRAPLKRQLQGAKLEKGETLLGLYEGVPLTEGYDGNMMQPDIITLFQEPIEAECETDDEIKELVRTTVIHEVAHYFGISDAELDEWGLG